MSSEKYFVFRSSPITEYSEVYSNDGNNLSVLSISTKQVAYITAKKGAVVIVFNNAGLYDTFQGTAREALSKTRIEIQCETGSEYDLIQSLTEFITNPSPARRVLRFDAVEGVSSMKITELSKVSGVKATVPKQPTIMSTQAISNDPASIDLTQTTTTTLDDITFTSPTLMPIVDYNPAGLAAVAVGGEVGQTHAWDNAGTGGNTYDIDNNTNAPVVSQLRTNGLREKAVDIEASPENLILANELVVEDDYTMYFVIGAVGFGSFGASLVDDGSNVHIGFASADGLENTNSEFWVKHNVSGGNRPAYMDVLSTDYDTTSYRFPDPKLEDGISNPPVLAQTCYVFMLRRDKAMNLYLHNHTGVIVGYAEAKTDSTDYATNGNLEVLNVGTGFRGNLARFGVIPSDIGAAEAARLCQDMFNRYRYNY